MRRRPDTVAQAAQPAVSHVAKPRAAAPRRSISRRTFIKTAAGLVMPAWMAGGATIIIPGPRYNKFGTAYDSEVLDWIARVVTNGGSVSQTTKDAANTFIASIKAVTGLRAAILRLNLFAGDQRAAALVPLIKDGGDPVDGVDGTGVQYAESTGIFVNVAAGGHHIATNLLDSQSPMTLSNQHIGIYLREKIGGEEALVMGTGSGGGATWIYFPAAGTSCIVGMHNGAGDLTVSDSVQTGHYIASRGSSGLFLYRNGSQVGTNASPGGALTGQYISICSANLNNNGYWSGAQTSRKSGGYHIGTDLTGTQEAAISSAFQAFNTTLARQV